MNKSVLNQKSVAKVPFKKKLRESYIKIALFLEQTMVGQACLSDPVLPRCCSDSRTHHSQD